MLAEDPSEEAIIVMVLGEGEESLWASLKSIKSNITRGRCSVELLRILRIVICSNDSTGAYVHQDR